MAKCGLKVLWLVILLAMTAVLLIVLLSGDVLLYLASRMVPMLWFGVAVLAALCAYQGYELIRCFRANSSVTPLRMGLVLFCVPILLMMTATPDANTPGSLPNQNLRLVSPVASSAETAETTGEGVALETNDTSAYIPCVLMDERAVFDPQADFFADYLLESPAALEGRTVTLYGFVYRDESFEEDMILVSRLMITCCAADASIAGFHVRVYPGIDLQLNDWIRVTGTIKTKSMLYYGTPYDFPVLTNGIILHGSAPASQYVYINP
ncbi:MAG: TIGR03943 family protein [Firmicutes bacterium]|nr:TIGR03943 family protein [Bacillota bacterium]